LTPLIFPRTLPAMPSREKFTDFCHVAMTAAEFKKKWSRYQGKETSAYQSHFDDLCRLLGQPTPNEADPSGTDFFCFQKGVIKDAELLGLDDSGSERPKKGFADVWKKIVSAGNTRANTKISTRPTNKLLRYRESLLNPPLLVVCDFDRYIVKTISTARCKPFTNSPTTRLTIPEYSICFVMFSPTRITCARSEQRRGSRKSWRKKLPLSLVPFKDGRASNSKMRFTRRELQVAQKKNLRIARFLNRIVFCFFAEDTGLLPKNLFSEIAKVGLESKQEFNESLEQLFRVMSKGGMFGHRKIRHFNGICSRMSRFLNLRTMKSAGWQTRRSRIGNLSSLASWARCLNARSTGRQSSRAAWRALHQRN